MSFVVFGCVVAILCAVLVRDKRKLWLTRLGLLDGVTGVVDRPTLRHGADGFPRLTGWRGGFPVSIELIPDTLTIRRLPQLWVSVTVERPVQGAPRLALLARPRGTEFFALADRLAYRCEPVFGLPEDVMIRGDGPAAQRLLGRLARPLGDLFADPRIKEVVLTGRGARIIWQAGEGKRGEHLLLRQAVFEGAEVQVRDLEKALDALEDLCAAAGPYLAQEVA